MPIEAQAAMIAELQLPCAAIVHSGGKSLHAIVKVDAKDASQYREHVETLYRFRYPLHTPDKTGVLGDIEPEETGALAARQREQCEPQGETAN